METVITAERVALGRTTLPMPDRRKDERARADTDVNAAMQGIPLTSGASSQLDEIARLRVKIRDELTAELASDRAATLAQAQAQGFAQGMEQGHESASTEIRRRFDELKARIEAALTSLHDAHECVLDECRQQIGAVAFEAVCRLVSQQFASKEFVRGIVERVCREAVGQSSLTVRLHPDDLQLLSDIDTRSLREGARVDFTPDSTLTLGGCVVDSDMGRFDGSLDTQLTRLHAVMCRQHAEASDK